MSVQELEAVRGMLRETDLALAGPVDQARANFAAMLAALPDPDGVAFEPVGWAGRTATTTGDPLRAEAVLLYLHGGAFAVGSGGAYRSLWGSLASASGAAGLAIDYRMAPEDVFPAAVDDAVAAYRALLDGGGVRRASRLRVTRRVAVWSSRCWSRRERPGCRFRRPRWRSRRGRTSRAPAGR
jgi:acetyl esterase/lipase